MLSKITIIIPVYKVERYLQRCLDSVLNQTFSDWVAIVVDDGSPDNSGKIADNYATRDGRFVVIHKENGGVSSARNAGLKIADSQYIMFMDGDDCLHPQAMEILYNLAERELVDVVAFEYDRDANKAPDAINFPPNKMPDSFTNIKYDINKIHYKRFNNLLQRSTNRDYGIKAWWVQNGMIWMRMYRHDFIRGLMFDEKISIMEDTVFWSLVLLRRPSGIITRLPLYYYTVNATSALHSNNHGIRRTLDTISGMHNVAKQYIANASPRDARMWAKRFLWNLMTRVLHGAMRMTNPADRARIADAFSKMESDGVLGLIPDLHAFRYSRKIKRFISQNQNS